MERITRIVKIFRFGRLWVLHLFAVTIMVLLPGCSIGGPTPLPTDGAFVSPVSPIPLGGTSAELLSDSSEGLPDGTQVVGGQYRGDFDGDGQLELASGYRVPEAGGGGIIVSDILGTGYRPVWQEEVSRELTPTDFLMQDLNGDGLAELVLFVEHGEGVRQYVFVYTQRESTYAALTPVGGPWDGQSAFLSLYWPPILDDVDYNTTVEIITFAENTSNPEALSAVVYEWNGSEFHHTTAYIIPPRFKPADSQ